MQRFTTKEYLAIDIANSFGIRGNWTSHLDWFNDHKDHLADQLSHAKEPALFFAGTQAMEAVERGEPIGYPISLDATASGMQILAILTGDRSAAEMCNVVPSIRGDVREDAYTVVYDHMLAEIGEDSKIERSDTKRAIMTALYGSQAVPKKVFGEGNLLAVFLKTMEKLAPAAWELNEAFLNIWDETALSNDWTLPDNFHVHVKVITQTTETVHFLNEPFQVNRNINAPMKDGRSLAANVVHSIDGMIVREMTRRCSYDAAWIQLVRDILDDEVESRFSTEDEANEAHKMTDILWHHYEETGFLSARILDYIDSDTLQLVDQKVLRKLVDSLPAKPFQLISIHDCFRCLPNYGNDLREQYSQQLHLIAKSSILSSILGQLLHRVVNIGKLDPTLADDILNSEYALS